jgi:hypothetical protein
MTVSMATAGVSAVAEETTSFGTSATTSEKESTTMNSFSELGV